MDRVLYRLVRRFSATCAWGAVEESAWRSSVWGLFQTDRVGQCACRQGQGRLETRRRTALRG